MRLLRPGHPDGGGGAARRNAAPDDAEIRAALDTQSVPLRHAPAHPARGARAAASAREARRERAPSAPLPAILAAPTRASTRWLRIDADGTVTLLTGKVELGQGLKTAIARIGAEELDVSLERIRVATADTARGPNELITVGQHVARGERQRDAPWPRAEARQHPARAAPRSGSACRSASSRSTTARSRARQRCAARPTGSCSAAATSRATRPASVAPSAAHEHRIVGKPGPRIDLRAKVTGGAFVHDLAPAGHAVRPRAAPAELPGAQLDALDDAPVRALPGVRRGRARRQLRRRGRRARGAGAARAATRSRRARAGTRRRRCPATSAPPSPARAAAPELPVTTARPARAPAARRAGERATHARSALPAPVPDARLDRPVGARSRSSKADTYGVEHSQGVSRLRAQLARALGLPPEHVRVIHADGAGCYGHNGADDVALDAALLARAVPGAAGAPAVDARGRARLGAVRPGDGGRSAREPRRRRSRARLEPRSVELHAHGPRAARGAALEPGRRLAPRAPAAAPLRADALEPHARHPPQRRSALRRSRTSAW